MKEDIKQLIYIINNDGACPPEDLRDGCRGCVLDRFCDIGNNSAKSCRLEAELQLENYTQEEIFEVLL